MRIASKMAWALVAVVALAVLPGCPEPEPEEAFVTFTSTSCRCVSGSIRVFVDGTQVGTVSCGQSVTVTVLPGVRTLTARDNTGNWGPEVTTLQRGGSFTYSLNC